MISVVTPCLNIVRDGREEFFRRMMTGIHRQTYSDVEHIVIDGGSADGTKRLLDAYLEKGWITRLVQEKKMGIYPAINTGLGLVRGEYVNIMNTDDYFTDLDYFHEALDAFSGNNIDFVHADRLIRSRAGLPDTVKRGDERAAYFRMPFRHQTMIIKKEVFDEIGMFDESYEICADYEWILRMLKAGKRGYYFPKAVVCSLSGGVSANRQKCVKEVSKILYETYGRRFGLNLEECRDIYLWNISDGLMEKIITRVKDDKILESLKYCHELRNKP